MLLPPIVALLSLLLPLVLELSLVFCHGGLYGAPWFDYAFDLFEILYLIVEVLLLLIHGRLVSAAVLVAILAGVSGDVFAFGRQKVVEVVLAVRNRRLRRHFEGVLWGILV